MWIGGAGLNLVVAVRSTEERALRFTVIGPLTMMALLIGCGTIAAPVALLTYDRQGCFAAPAVGELVADGEYGTAIVYDGTGNPARRPQPVSWPRGFSGRLAGGEIEVVAPYGRDGTVIAVTGKRYEFVGGWVEVRGIATFWACGPVEPR